MERLFRHGLFGLWLCLATTLSAAEPPGLPPVNINEADAAELADGLRGVGEARALAIIADREANGAFASVDDLTRVSGIGMATVEANRERMVVGSTD